MIADYIIFVADKGRCLSTIKQHKSSICDTIRRAAGVNHAENDVIRDLLKGLEKSYKPKAKPVPAWDLSLVFKALSQHPFEPLEEANVHYLTLKTVFLVTWATAARVSEIHALCMDSDHMQWASDNSSVKLIAASGFLAKNQRASDPPRAFTIHALNKLVPSGEDELLCPVRALRRYLAYTESYRGDRTKLFLNRRHSSRVDVGKPTVSRWIREAIIACYDMVAPEDRAEALGAHAHQVRGLAASMCVARNRPIKEVMSAAYWRSESCFTAFYLKDMARYEVRVPSTEGMHTSVLGMAINF